MNYGLACTLIGLLWSVAPVGLRAENGGQALPAAYAEVSVARGLLALRENRPNLAKKAFEEALDEDPGNKDAQAGLALALERLKKTDEAVAKLEALHRERPSDPEVCYQLGRVYAKAGREKEALPLLKKAWKLNPKRPDVGLQLGTLLFRRGSYGLSAKVLKRAVYSSPKTENVGRFYEGLSLAKLGMVDEADKRLKMVEESNAAPSFAEVAGTIRKKLPERPAAKPFRFFTRVAASYDDNANFVPDSDVFNLRSKDHDTAGGTVSARVEYDIIRKPAAEITLRGDYYQTINFDLPNTNVSNVAGEVLWNFRGLSFGLPFQSGLSLRYDQLLVDANSFLDRIGLSPSFTLVQKQWMSTRVNFRYQFRNFRALGAQEGTSEDRDGDSFGAGLNQTFIYRRARIHFGYDFSVNNADGSNYDYHGHRFSAGVVAPLPVWQVECSVDTSVFLQDYHGVNSLFGTRRDDVQSLLNVTLRKPLKHNVNIFGEYSYTNNDSDIALFEYNRSMYQVGAEWRF